MAETQEAKEERWRAEDRIAQEGAKSGNAFATLCTNCYGRHRAPRDKECPYPQFVRAMD